MMKAKVILAALLLTAAIGLESCKKNTPIMPGNVDTEVPTIEDILNGDDQELIGLLNKVRGSVGRRGPASKTIWSRKNDYGLGLYISANHVYGLAGWSSRNAQFLDPTAANLGIFETSQIPPANGNIALGKTQIADFPIMHFDISAAATDATLLPAEDFYLGLIDNQRVEQGPFAKNPEPIKTPIPLEMYDPANRTKASSTWADPVPGQKAIAVGYPQDKTLYPNGAATYGKILSDSEAINTIEQLKAAGDSEGKIPYNSNVEFFMQGKAIGGMSGGGVFDSNGHLLGIMVRASDAENAPEIIRVVRASHIRSNMVEFYNRLPEPSKSKVRAFISGEL